MALKMKLNKEEYLNKVHGCWIGKNIGGTLGDPYEGTYDMLDIKGFSTEKGEPAPNDDLDLQLVWLKAMQQVGPKAMSANVLAYYWMTHITPYWNEYGIAKANLEMGLLPPLSGEMNNSTWKYSNGAWIRSEIWACFAPGIPNIAIKYAIMDASVDHGLSEGTYAEIFTASL
ncbi:MAG: ADP-ribosylglycohydrolase family protein, partial [Ruminococcaceae bacterium]|nr:ADP-ribosylglycohydrolase family protein [Oscillospiraceae bacterium]